VQNRAPAASGAPHDRQAALAGAGGGGGAADEVAAWGGGAAGNGAPGWGGAPEEDGAEAPGVAGDAPGAVEVPGWTTSVPQLGQTLQRGSSMTARQFEQRVGANGSGVRQNGQTATSRMMKLPHRGQGTL
jgi:hypothetical protein